MNLPKKDVLDWELPALKDAKKWCEKNVCCDCKYWKGYCSSENKTSFCKKYKQNILRWKKGEMI